MTDSQELREQLQPTQDRLPRVKEVIDRVGISGLRTILKLSNAGGETHFAAEIDLFIDLPEDRKGIHMSRLVESINEVVSRSSRRPKASFEKLGMGVLAELKKRHRYSRGEIAIKTTLFLSRHTPVTGKKTDEPYDVEIGVVSQGEKIYKKMRVKAIGNTLCPHSLETTHGKAHVQRAELDLLIEAPIKEKIPLEELINICENSFSSPTYTVLKTV
ncbi:MAG TPA: GTP cyclohydrolase, FolE2/MptA family, partial [Nitrososphaerales archaeon]|nr:GTP cyclohydrolase, FolE2/MptA family [Nitrososphaerales archaeon]